MKKIIFVYLFLIVFALTNAKEYTLSSPDNKIIATISVEKRILYSLSFNGADYLLPSGIGLELSTGQILGDNPIINKVTTKSINDIVKPLYGINKEIVEQYNKLKI